MLSERSQCTQGTHCVIQLHDILEKTNPYDGKKIRNFQGFAASPPGEAQGIFYDSRITLYDTVMVDI